MGKSPHIAILLAVIVGAFSPFCSCGVIPVVYSLLKGGIPLAPVMAFWIASPSMDPEIFFLSAGFLGWNLAVWRLASTLLLSLAAGYLTLWMWRKGYLGEQVLKGRLLTGDACDSCSCGEKIPAYKRLMRQTAKSSFMVGKFMLLALVLTACIKLLMPQGNVEFLSESGGAVSVIVASLIGVPFYTSNLTAMPMIGAMLQHGLEPAAALAFLVAGPVTTLPAMSAVWGLANKRVFFLYFSFALLGSMVAGFAFLGAGGAKL